MPRTKEKPAPQKIVKWTGGRGFYHKGKLIPLVGRHVAMDAFTENKETIGKSRRNNEAPSQASNTHTEKSKFSINTNNEHDNVTLAEYAERIYPLRALASVSKIKSYNAEEKSHKKSIQAAYKANSNQGYHNNSNNDSGRGKSGMRSQKPVKNGNKENIITIDDHEKTVGGLW